jgi:hypothetical protein
MLTPARDARPGSWIVDSLHGFAADAGSVVPPVFEAYVRVFHPADLRERPVTWAEIARANGRRVHPAMQFHALVPAGSVDEAGNRRAPQPDLWDDVPRSGSLDRDIVERLLPVLRARTKTPERCWFAFWDGWGIPVALVARKGLVARLFGARERAGVPDHRVRERWRAPTFSIPGRDLLLFAGALEDALEGFYDPSENDVFQSAYFWWPDDAAWCVATEIDLMSTYIGASDACAEAILRVPAIEALRASVEDEITASADKVNADPFAG